MTVKVFDERGHIMEEPNHATRRNAMIPEFVKASLSHLATVRTGKT